MPGSLRNLLIIILIISGLAASLGIQAGSSVTSRGMASHLLFNQQGDDVGASPLIGGVDGSSAIAVTQVPVSALSQQQFDNVCVSEIGGQMKNGSALVVRRVQLLWIAGQYRLDPSCIPGSRRLVNLSGPRPGTTQAEDRQPGHHRLTTQHRPAPFKAYKCALSAPV